MKPGTRSSRNCAVLVDQAPTQLLVPLHDFGDFIGCKEGADAKGETRILLEAFSDHVESENLPEEVARELTYTLVDYASSQAKRCETIALDALSKLLTTRPHEPSMTLSRATTMTCHRRSLQTKRTLNQFRRFTGRAEGLSISFEAHLLGSWIKFDEERDVLEISEVSTQLRDQSLSRA